VGYIRGAFVCIFSLGSDGANICATWAFKKRAWDGIFVVAVRLATEREKL